MSIASELSALNGYILGAYDEISDKGGTIPQNKNMANLASAIASISGGGGGGDVDISNFLGLTKAVSGTFSVSDSTTERYTVDHNLGILPKLAMFVAEGVEKSETVRYIVGGFTVQTGTMNQSTKLMNSGVHIGAGWVLGRTTDTSAFSTAGGPANVSTASVKTQYVGDLYSTSTSAGGTSYGATTSRIYLATKWGTYTCVFAPNKTYYYLIAG